MEKEAESLDHTPQKFQSFAKHGAQNVVVYDDPFLSKRIELIESGHKRIEKSQEEMRHRFTKMEDNIDSIEKLTQKSLKTQFENRNKDTAYWEKLTNIKDDASKKAINIGMGILLAVAVGILIPYFKSEKLALVNDPDLAKILTNWEKDQLLKDQALGPLTNPLASKHFLISLKFVNLRTAPKLQSKTILTIPPNQRVRLLKKYGGWQFISFFDHVQNREVKGWAYHEFFKHEKKSS
jgi:hypothetical protein